MNAKSKLQREPLNWFGTYSRSFGLWIKEVIESKLGLTKSGMQLETETVEFHEHITSIRRIVTRMDGAYDAITFNGETVHVDPWKLEIPDGWQPLWIDGAYWGEAKRVGASDCHRTSTWRAVGQAASPPIHDHPYTECVVFIKGHCTVTMLGRERTYFPGDTLTIDRGVAHSAILCDGGIAQVTWVKCSK